MQSKGYTRKKIKTCQPEKGQKKTQKETWSAPTMEPIINFQGGYLSFQGG